MVLRTLETIFELWDGKVAIWTRFCFMSNYGKPGAVTLTLGIVRFYKKIEVAATIWHLPCYRLGREAKPRISFFFTIQERVSQMARPIDNSPAGVLRRQAKVLNEVAKRIKAFQTLKVAPDEETLRRFEFVREVLAKLSEAYGS